jgi:hypothetical protein
VELALAIITAGNEGGFYCGAVSAA